MNRAPIKNAALRRSGCRLFAALLLAAAAAFAQEQPLPALGTEYLFTIEAGIAAPIVMGQSVDGHRQSIPITGGIVHGENISGEVLAGGADYQLRRGDGSTQLRAVYMIRTDDGALINVVNEGLLVPPGTAGNERLYFRTSPRFTAPEGKYGWLNNGIHVGAVRSSPARPDTVIIDVYRVL